MSETMKTFLMEAAIQLIVASVAAAIGAIVGAYVGHRLKKPEGPKPEESKSGGPQPASAPVPTSVRENLRKWTVSGGVFGAILFLVLAWYQRDYWLSFVTTHTYDNFSTAEYDEYMNTKLWTETASPPDFVSQGDGVMLMVNRVNGNAASTMYSKQTIQGNEDKFAEARISLNDEELGSTGYVSFSLRTTDAEGRDVVFQCLIDRGAAPEIWCEVYRGGSRYTPEYKSSRIVTDYNKWHTVKIGVDSNVNVTFYIDRKLVGTYRPTDAYTLRLLPYRIYLEVWCPQQDGIAGEFDRVRADEGK